MRTNVAPCCRPVWGGTALRARLLQPPRLHVRVLLPPGLLPPLQRIQLYWWEEGPNKLLYCKKSQMRLGFSKIFPPVDYCHPLSWEEHLSQFHIQHYSRYLIFYFYFQFYFSFQCNSPGRVGGGGRGSRQHTDTDRGGRARYLFRYPQYL